MKFPDIKLSYPNGNLAIEIAGVDATLGEALTLAPALTNLALRELPKLQPLVNDFYNMYTTIKRLRGG
jgi:hypothetical protein